MRVHDMTLPAAAVAALQRALDELRSQPAYVYPWAGLTGGVRLVGYGSLLNAASAARTLAPGGARRPVLAFGARRLFDCEMSAGALQRYGAGADSRGGAALNVRITSVIGDAEAYYLLCREGAASVSESFLRFFLASTFLADGLTPVAEWEREV